MGGSGYTIDRVGCKSTINRVGVLTCSVFSTLLETVPFVIDHLWTQDRPIFPLTFGGKTGPYIDQGGSALKVLNKKNTNNEY